jgi:hypothetical protein
LNVRFNLLSSILPSSIQLPDILAYLLAILGLTLIWKFHDMLVKAGRIQAKDFWERSGVRIFLFATPPDSCIACRAANNFAYSLGVVTSKKFSPLQKPCQNNPNCLYILVGLYGGWAEAWQLLVRLKQEGGTMWIVDGELKALLEKSSTARAGASSDRLSLRMLEAMRSEESNPSAAIEHYRGIIAGAVQDRDLHLVVPAFIRLSVLLQKAGQKDEARSAVERCLTEYGPKKKGPGAPTEGQRVLLTKRLAALKA